MSATFSTLIKSSNSTEYQTPLDFFIKLHTIFNFKIDAATTIKNPLGMDIFYTKIDDGLSCDWNGNTFINPPFGAGVLKWINKMKYEAQKHIDKVYVMLLPARVETKWFQDHIYGSELSDVYLIKGRLCFVNPILNKKKQPHIMGSMLWILNASRDEIEDLQDAIPGVLM